MFKMRIAMPDGQEVWVLGLTRQERQVLNMGGGLPFNLSSLGGPAQRVVILGGETEELMETQIHRLLDDIERRTQSGPADSGA